MLALKDFAVPFGVLCIALWVWLFWAKPTMLLLFFFVTVVAMILLYRHEDVVQVVFEQKRILVQMTEIKKEIFAKVEELRRLAEKMGELTAFNIAQLWRLAPEDPEAVRLAERDRLQKMLTDMGISGARAKEITSKITEMVTWDLAQQVWHAVPREIFSQEAAKGVDPAKARERLTETLIKSPLGKAQKAAQDYLQPLGGWTRSVESKIVEFDEFRKTGRLPAVKQSH